MKSPTEFLTLGLQIVGGIAGFVGILKWAGGPFRDWRDWRDYVNDFLTRKHPAEYKPHRNQED